MAHRVREARQRDRALRGRVDSLDGIILGSGYRLSLPFISDEAAATLDLDGQGLDLRDHTVHPDLDGLGFIGLYSLVGP